MGLIRSLTSSHTSYDETVSIVIALVSIVFISVVLGSTLPLMLQAMHVDPAHSSTSIQVIMDILGVLITCGVAMYILNSSNVAAGDNISDIAMGDIVAEAAAEVEGQDVGNGGGMFDTMAA